MNSACVYSGVVKNYKELYPKFKIFVLNNVVHPKLKYSNKKKIDYWKTNKLVELSLFTYVYGDVISASKVSCPIL